MCPHNIVVLGVYSHHFQSHHGTESLCRAIPCEALLLHTLLTYPQIDIATVETALSLSELKKEIFNELFAMYRILKPEE